ncbi:hemagglutinin repeat-containing protein [Methylobacillus gramineus]|uniref:two-partner secretion domain-containing protein n=1 Tax=Methylobacillus gramineus TaxID=755169 RepID=UPI001CFF9D15|nr:hemagglutinin repeat-containing protein [Methylobacillus gramineus]MCB5183820.1 hemagglutinin repeat-containing protein [Methylobacillus gramineus]
MNKHCYRLVFNRARGLMMAVAEHASAANRSTRAYSRRHPISSDHMAHFVVLAGISRLQLSLMLILGTALIVPYPVLADIIADPSAPGNQQPIISNTANGLPLVNIQTPSAAGVSRNTYSQFDVNAQGAILNNSNTNAETQLGGWVQGNPLLAGGTARVILNEVNSSNPSILNGFIEIAGSRAQLVIANPAGISCNGCGFINANRATLTTGTPILNSGNLLGYRVGGGNISFSGNGMDARQVNYTNIISRAVQVNSGIWANDLNITTGSNQVNIDSNGNQSSVTAIAPSAATPPAFAVDVAALGGMYTGKIHLIGTEAGMGVRNAGHIGASVGEVVVTVDGQISNSGTLAAHTDIHITTNHGMQNAGSINANAELNLNAGNINNLDTGNFIASSTTLLSQGTLTNRGTIDGDTTHISTNRLDNMGRGSIFGDHLSIQASEINNLAETVNGITTAAIIASRTRLTLAIDNLQNRDNAMLFSGGDMSIGGTLDASGIATGSAASIINQDATIETLGNMTIAAASLQNLNTGLQVRRTAETTAGYDKFTPRDQGIVWDSADYPSAHIGNVGVEWRSAGPYSFREYTRYQGTSYTSHTEVLASTPGKILSGGNMQITGNVLNSDSQIIAGAALDISGATIQNLNTEGQTIVRHSGGAWYYDWDGKDDEYDIDYLGNHSPGNIVTTYNLTTSRLEGNGALPASSTVITSTPHTANTNALFQAAPNPNANYLIETNPRFSSYRNWLNSDYMAQQLAFDPAITQKRLGDGFYEQRLIREQVARLTGRRFLDGYANDEAQYQALMNAGLTIASHIRLIPGVALTPAQTAQLTSDIVWLVEQEVTLPDGTVTKALVPQVYVRLQDGDLSPTIGIMAGKQIKLDITADLLNTSTIAGRNTTIINADNVHNLRGTIAATSASIKAARDIDNIGGILMAKNALTLEASNNINLESTTQSHAQTIGASSFSRTNLDRVAGLYVSNPNAILVASAGNDLNLMAASIVNSGSNGVTSLKAGNDMNLGTVQIAEQNNSVRNTSNRVSYGFTQDIGTAIQTSGDILLQAGNDVSIKAGNLNSENGNLGIAATGDINIIAGEASSNFDQARKTKRSSGVGSSTTKTYRTISELSEAIGSALSADNIRLQAGAPAETTSASTGDINITGSNVVSTTSTQLQASGDINLSSAENTSYTFNQKTTKKSGFSTGGSSIGYGTSNLDQKQTGTTVTQVGSTVGSVEGNVSIHAAKTYTQTGSDVLTPKGDIDITAQQVNITAGNNTSTQTTETKFKQSGLTLAITSPVISAIQTATQMQQASKQVDDSRLQALAAATVVASTKNAADAIASNPGAAGGFNLSLSIGTSKSSSTSTQTNSTVQGSNIVAGGDLSIKATGADELSDINVIGSTIKAGSDVNLTADDEVNLIAAQNKDTLTSKNKSSSASVGISIGSNGLAITASASQGKGKASGTDVTWTESLVQAGNKAIMESGTDTDIIGSQVRGEQVVVNVGTSGNGNLNVQSLQDTSTYDSKQKSSSFSISIPIGAGVASGSISSSSSKAHSDYASVNEQAGIYAGDGGFQVNVNGNTDLKGAVIASNQSAIEQQKNSLSTDTLTVSDIRNSAEYSASSESTGVTLSYDASKSVKKNTGNNLVNAPSTLTPDLEKNGEDSSTTYSAISAGVISITNADKQQALTGQDAQTTIAKLNRDTENANPTPLDKHDIAKIQQDIQATNQIISAVTAEAVQAINTYYEKRVKEYDAQYQETLNEARSKENQAQTLEVSGDTEAAHALKQEAQILRAQAINIRNERDNPTLSQGETLALSSLLISGLGTGQVNLANAATTYSVGSAGDKFLLVAQKRDSDIAQGFVVQCQLTPAQCVEEASKNEYLKNAINNPEIALEERIEALRNLQTPDENGNPQSVFGITIVDDNNAGYNNVAINGIMNEPDRALVLAIGHLRDGQETKQQLYLSYNDTQGTVADLLNASIDKYTGATSNTSVNLGNAITAAQKKNPNENIYLYAHSGGTLISAISLNDLVGSGQTLPNLKVDFLGPAASISAAADASINAAGLSNATLEEKMNWIKYGNTNGLPTDLKPVQVPDYININYGLGYYNHSNDTVATIVGGNVGMSDQYQGVNLVGQVPGSESRNMLTSLQEIYALFTRNDSAHSTYRWNDPKTWPTTQLPNSISQQPKLGAQ